MFRIKNACGKSPIILKNAPGNILAREGENIRSFAVHFCSLTGSNITADIDKLLTEPLLIRLELLGSRLFKKVDIELHASGHDDGMEVS